MSAKEQEKIRIDFWDRIVQSHGIPTLDDDKIELSPDKCNSALCLKSKPWFVNYYNFNSDTATDLSVISFKQALAAEVIKTIRDIISLNPLYKEFLAQLIEGGKKVADNPVHLADFGMWIVSLF